MNVGKTNWNPDCLPDFTYYSLTLFIPYFDLRRKRLARRVYALPTRETRRKRAPTTEDGARTTQKPAPVFPPTSHAATRSEILPMWRRPPRDIHDLMTFFANPFKR